MNNLISKIQILLSFLSATVLFSCNQQELPERGEAASQPLTLHVTDGGFSNGTTRSVDNNYTTTFESGDALGILTIKSDGTVASHIKATCDGTNWTPESPILAYANATYIAYTPYDADLVTSAVSDIEGIKSSFQIQENQSNRERYVASDLMTGTGTLTGTQLSFTLSHAFAMVEVVLPRITYKFIDSSIPDYHIPSATFNPEDANGPTMYESSPNAWRRILKPGESFELKGSYTGADDKIRDYYKLLSGDALQEGHCVSLEIDEGQTLSFKANQGDLMLKDGTILSKQKLTTDEEREKVLGIIIYKNDSILNIGSRETAVLNDKSITPHGYVLALKDATYNNSSTFYWGNGWDSTYGTCFETLKEVFYDFDGLGHTESIKALYPDCAMIQGIEAYNASYAPPTDLMTDWFLPSSGQWFAIARKLGIKFTIDQMSSTSGSWISHSYTATENFLEKLNNKLENVGGSYVDEFKLSNKHWSSTEASSQYAFGMFFWDNGKTFTLSGEDKRYSHYIRCILAF